MKSIIKFLNTNLEKLDDFLEKNFESTDEYVLGLSNSDFFINLVEVPENFTDEQKYTLINEQLALVIDHYNPMEYINKKILNDYSSNNEQILVISLARNKIESITDKFLANKIFLIGIYPSFLLNDQDSLIKLSTELEFISIIESKYESVEPSGESSPILILLSHGEVLDLREDILSKKDLFEYNFLQPEYKNKFRKPLVSKKVKQLIWLIIFLQIFIFSFIKYSLNKIESDIKTLVLENKKNELEIKNLEKKILDIPDWIAKIKTFQYIFSEKNIQIHKLMYTVKKNMPPGLFLNEFLIKNSSIYLAGTCENPDKLFLFERNLSKNSFSNINFNIISKVEKGYIFSLEAEINQ